MAQAVQALTADDRSNTILSVDGVGAFDFVSRGAMMSGFLRMGGAAGPCCLSSANFTGDRPFTSGITKMAKCTRLCKGRAESRGTH